MLSRHVIVLDEIYKNIFISLMINDWMHYVGMGNSELTILTDFDAPIEVQQYVFGELNDRGILHSTHSIETLRSV